MALVFRPLMAALLRLARMETPHPALELFLSRMVRNVGSEIRSCHPANVVAPRQIQHQMRRSLRNQPACLAYVPDGRRQHLVLVVLDLHLTTALAMGSVRGERVPPRR